VKFRPNFFLILIGSLILFIAAAALVVHLVELHAARDLPALVQMFPETGSGEEISWAVAAQKVKEDRGEPVGRQAQVEIPAQLKHYNDTRRFLATQVAEVMQHQLETPRDFVDLAGMIGHGEFAHLPTVKDTYILFGVGGSANEAPFTRFQNGHRISLYSEAELRQEYERLGESQEKLASEIAGLKQQISGLNRRDRWQRNKLQTQIGGLEQTVKLNRESKALLDRYYENAVTRRDLFADYQSLQEGARKLSGGSFDITVERERRQMKVYMLSSLRPAALKVLEEVATSYHAKFDRPLPVTSLVRPDEYQLELSKTNANATRIETPPHSTGLAFDILYRYMTAAEQAHVMSDLARLKDEGRIEVLRENRDHYHVFAFVDAARPREGLIAAAMNRIHPGADAKLAGEAHHSRKRPSAAKHESKRAQHKSKKTRTSRPKR